LALDTLQGGAFCPSGSSGAIANELRATTVAGSAVRIISPFLSIIHPWASIISAADVAADASLADVADGLFVGELDNLSVSSVTESVAAASLSRMIY